MNQSPATSSRQYRKKPVVIDAVQWFKPGDDPRVYFRAEDGNRCWEIAHQDNPRARPVVDSKEGWHFIEPGYWIITGVEGETYGCDPRIFEKTYEPASLSETAAPLQTQVRLLMDAADDFLDWLRKTIRAEEVEIKATDIGAEGTAERMNYLQALVRGTRSAIEKGDAAWWKLSQESPPTASHAPAASHVDGRWCADLQCGKCYSAETWIKSQAVPSAIEQPTVWSVEGGWSYEGYELVGVFATETAAKEAAAKTEGYEYTRVTECKIGEAVR